jgi:hypothetical protein
MTALNQMKENLKKGLSIDNLYELKRQSMEIAKQADDPLPFYVLASIFFDIIDDWDERPLLDAKAKKMEQAILDKLDNVIDGLIEKRQSNRMYDDLNSLVRSFVQNSVG